MRHTRSFAFLALVILASGCAAEPARQAAGQTSPGPTYAPPTFALGNGAIDGLVTDDSLTPVPAADVGLVPGDRVGQTDAAGRFSFSNVAPGRYSLVIQRLGFEDRVTSVDVRAEEITVLQVTLRPFEIPEPYQHTYQQQGMIECNASVAVRPANKEQNLGMCSSDPRGNKAMTYFVWETANGTGVWMETVWKSTQALGSTLRVNWRLHPPGSSFSAFSGEPGKTGKSPIQLAQNFTKLYTEDGRFNCRSSREANAPIDGHTCSLEVWHWPGADTLPGAPVDVGVTLNQRFDDYATVFYNQPLPDSFTALADA